MFALARLADRGPGTAAALVTALLVAGIMLPVLVPVSSVFAIVLLVASSALLALVALRHGWPGTARTLLISLGSLAVVSVLLLGSVTQVLVAAFMFWVPALLAAMAVRLSVDLRVGVLVSWVCGVTAFIAMSVMTRGDNRFWEERFRAVFELPGAQLQGLPADQLDELITVMSGLMNTTMGVTVMGMGLGGLLLARSWQARLVNPGGFQQEFHRLQLGRQSTFACLALVAATVLVNHPLLSAMATLAICAFCVQGLSVVHSLVKQKGLSSGWLIGIYLLLLLPQTILLLGALGLADNLFRIRTI